MSKKLFIGLGLCLCLSAAPVWSQTDKPTTAPVAKAEIAAKPVISISDSEYNRVVFPARYKQVIFPPGTPIKGKPLPISNNRGILFQVKKGSKKVIQMVVHMTDGSVTTLRFKPASIPGIVYRVDGAPDVVPKTSHHAEANEAPAVASRFLVPIFRAFTQGSVAEGYEHVAALPPVAFKEMTAVPLGAWSDGEYRMLKYKLVAKPGADVPVHPSQFYRKGVRAVQVESDRVNRYQQPALFILIDEATWGLSE